MEADATGTRNVEKFLLSLGMQMPNRQGGSQLDGSIRHRCLSISGRAIEVSHFRAVVNRQAQGRADPWSVLSVTREFVLVDGRH